MFWPRDRARCIGESTDKNGVRERCPRREQCARYLNGRMSAMPALENLPSVWVYPRQTGGGCDIFIKAQTEKVHV